MCYVPGWWILANFFEQQWKCVFLANEKTGPLHARMRYETSCMSREKPHCWKWVGVLGLLASNQWRLKKTMPAPYGRWGGISTTTILVHTTTHDSQLLGLVSPKLFASFPGTHLLLGCAPLSLIVLVCHQPVLLYLCALSTQYYSILLAIDSFLVCLYCFVHYLACLIVSSFLSSMPSSLIFLVFLWVFPILPAFQSILSSLPFIHLVLAFFWVFSFLPAF